MELKFQWLNLSSDNQNLNRRYVKSALENYLEANISSIHIAATDVVDDELL